MNKTLNGLGFQSQYYDYLDAMVAATPSIFCKDDKEKNSFPAATLVAHRGDIARSIADSVIFYLDLMMNSLFFTTLFVKFKSSYSYAYTDKFILLKM